MPKAQYAIKLYITITFLDWLHIEYFGYVEPYARYDLYSRSLDWLTYRNSLRYIELETSSGGVCLLRSFRTEENIGISPSGDLHSFILLLLFIYFSDKMSYLPGDHWIGCIAMESSHLYLLSTEMTVAHLAFISGFWRYNWSHNIGKSLSQQVKPVFILLWMFLYSLDLGMPQDNM